MKLLKADIVNLPYCWCLYNYILILRKQNVKPLKLRPQVGTEQQMPLLVKSEKKIVIMPVACTLSIISIILPLSFGTMHHIKYYLPSQHKP